ncbi:twin-arginine translocase TatA/TatE family subunit [Alienimonas sp. DA493]|uniref:twin-arginine translocase TatA/TatE family subunit n=1 Tax=Alienimonas sp. DA493 TaxID=3373605 RepID=UPI003754009B
MYSPSLALIGMPGLPEMAIFAVIVLVLFGKRLPGAMKSLGQSVGALKQGLNESQALDDEPAPPAVESTTKTPTAA